MNGDSAGPPAPFRFVSGSPDVLRRCPFASQDYSGYSDSDSSVSESLTGIVMLSLPDSFEEKDSHLYTTAAEELEPIGSDGGNAVDLGRDTDVGLFSEVQSTMKTGEEGESNKSELPIDESVVSFGELSSKKLRLSEEALGSSSCARTVPDKFPADSTNSGGGSKIVPASSVGHNNVDENSGGKCRLKRMYDGKDSSAEKEMKNSRMDDGKVSNGENHCNYKEKSAGKEVKERVEKFQSHQQSNLQAEEIANVDQSAFRVLPPSISGVKKNAAGKKSNTSEDHPVEFTLLDILKILKGHEESKSKIDDKNLSKLGLLDIFRLCGMTFPRPTWWPPEY